MKAKKECLKIETTQKEISRTGKDGELLFKEVQKESKCIEGDPFEAYQYTLLGLSLFLFLFLWGIFKKIGIVIFRKMTNF